MTRIYIITSQSPFNRFQAIIMLSQFVKRWPCKGIKNDSNGVVGRLLPSLRLCVCAEHNSDYLPHRGEAPGPVKNGVNFSSYGKAKNGLSMATERVLKGGNTEHAISDPLFVRAHTLAHSMDFVTRLQ